MTISSTNRKAGPYAGNDVATAFPFSFKVFSAADVYAVRADSAGDETDLALTTDYTISLNADQNANPGGTLTLLAPLASSYTLTISSKLDYLQPTDLTNNGGFYPKVITNSLDRLTIFCQQLYEQLSRSLKLAISVPPGVKVTLPVPVPYHVLGWDSTGTQIVNADPTNMSTLSGDLASSATGKGSKMIAFIQRFTGGVKRWVEEKLADVISVKDAGAVGDGTSDDTSAVAAAVARCCATGDWLYWPAGTYLTTATIPNFHYVKHFGPGVVKSGSSLFYPGISSYQANTLYVATTGNDTNDGLSASRPMQTIQAAFNALYGYGPVLEGAWTVQLAAGTYGAATTLIGLRSKNNIVIKGPNVGGHPNVPTAVIDGTAVSNGTGMYLQFWISATIQDVKFQNWTYNSSAVGLQADGHCQLYLNNAHFQNCTYAGVSCDNLTQVRMLGGIVDGCPTYGVRLYSQVSASIGYTGSGVGSSTIIRNCFTGIFAAVSSRLHADYVAFRNNTSYGIYTEKNTRTVANYCEFTSNAIAVLTQQSSVYGESGGTNTFTTNGKDYVCYSSVDDVGNYQTYWDRSSQRTLYGASAYRSVAAKYEWQLDSSNSGSSYNSNTKAVFDFNGAGTNWLGLSGPTTSSVGLLCSTVAKPAQGAIYYNFSSDNWQLWLANQATAYRWNSSKFGPDQDNSKTLGDSGFRWSTVYAGTGTINTSDAREKQQIQELSEQERAVALRLKSLVRTFKFNDAVEAKGDKARVHCGVIAQDVKAAFEAEGLVAEDYAILCYDEWDEQQEVVETWDDEFDEDGSLRRPAGSRILEPYRPAGNRYGVRYEELLAFILGATVNA